MYLVITNEGDYKECMTENEVYAHIDRLVITEKIAPLNISMYKASSINWCHYIPLGHFEGSVKERIKELGKR